LINKNELSKDDIKNMMTFLGDVDKSFGFIFRKRKRKYIPLTVGALLKEREQYRQANNFDKADELRAEIKKLGYTVDDTPHGPVVKKIK